MEPEDTEGIAGWIVERGLAGASELELLEGFCARCRAVGVDLARGLLIIDTLHPVYEGRAFRWRDDDVAENPIVNYGRTNQGGDAATDWVSSPLYALFASGQVEMRRSLLASDPEFPVFGRMRGEGLTGFMAYAHRFAREHSLGEMDCVLSQWSTRAPGGFSDAQAEAMRRLVPILALAAKSASLAHLAGTLMEVYLGRDPGQRVLGGRIMRGVADRISAVLWFSDLRGYTTISDGADPAEIIPFLNDYAEAVISAVHEAGGDVLKLIGDGTLAVFKADDPAEACRCALAAEATLRRSLSALNERRRGEGRPVTGVYLGLHIGDVFYGNIGSQERLDFTVVGPAVNEVSRIAAMCRSVDRHVVLSSDFAQASPPEERARLVSVGRFALRGVGRAQELFTLDPAFL